MLMRLPTAEHARLREHPGASEDPTNTKTVRDKFGAEVYRRFRAVKGELREAIEANDAAAELAPRQFDSEGEFDRWLDATLTDEVLDSMSEARIERGEHWTGSYIAAAYERGVKDAGTNLRRLGIVAADELTDAEQIDFAQMPVHSDAIRSMWRRQFSELDGITDAVAQEVRRELADGVIDGVGSDELARRLNERVDAVGMTRARTLARTETVRAHNEAALSRYERHGVDEVTTVVELLTAQDARVCEECQSLSESGGPNNDGTWPIDEAHGILPVHPNCRCTFIPVVND